MTNNTVDFKKSCGVLNSASLTRSWGTTVYACLQSLNFNKLLIFF
uniref:Uncharacterized protein n=1 Tax=Anguilla anguilla TaxID=7936 RepID=A0A0E9PY48_ANGAN